MTAVSPEHDPARHTHTHTSISLDIINRHFLQKSIPVGLLWGAHRSADLVYQMLPGLQRSGRRAAPVLHAEKWKVRAAEKSLCVVEKSKHQKLIG